MLTIDELESLDAKYRIFGEHREAALTAYWDICMSDVKCASLEKAAELVRDAKTAEEIKRLPVANDNAIRYFAIIANLTLGRERYIARGFSEEETDEMIGRCFGGSLDTCMKKSDAFGYTTLYFWWAGLYVTNEIFNFRNMQLETRIFHMESMWLRHKETKELVALKTSGKVHRSGVMLGSEGCTDEAGAYDVTFTETETEITANVIENDLVLPTVKTYPKSEWEVFLRKGDPVVAFHFPRNADIRPESLQAFFKEGVEAVKTRYPDFKAKTYFCCSWLLDCKMSRFLKPTSNINGFREMMSVCPYKSDGHAVFGYVFPPKVERLEDLPETTSLERGLKELYLNGEYIYTLSGIRPFDLCV